MGHEPQPWTQLYELRLQAGLTQPQLAKLSGVDQARISNYENGRRHPSRTHVKALIEALPGLDDPTSGDTRSKKAAA